jgi:hypothetical protein
MAEPPEIPIALPDYVELMVELIFRFIVDSGADAVTALF